MCRIAGRRCPSSLSRRAGGTRLPASAYTRAVRVLTGDPALCARTASCVADPELIALAGPSATTTAMDRRKARMGLGRAAFQLLEADPRLLQSAEARRGAGALVFEQWRLHGPGLALGAPPAHAHHDFPGESLAAVLDSAAEKARASVRAGDVTRAARAAQRADDELALHALAAFGGPPESGSPRAHLRGWSENPVHVPEDIVAELTASDSLQSAGRTAAHRWLGMRGISPAEVDLYATVGEITPAHPDTPRGRAVAAVLEREWDRPGAPTITAFGEHIRSVGEARAARGIDVEFARADHGAPEWQGTGTFTEQALLAAAYSGPQPADTPRETFYRRESSVGGGDADRAAHLLRGPATLAELGAEAARLDLIPEDARRGEAVSALEERAARHLLIDAGIHPRHLDGQRLPEPVAARLREALAAQVLAAGEDFYADSGMSEDFLGEPPDERARIVAAESVDGPVVSLRCQMASVAGGLMRAAARNRLAEQESAELERARAGQGALF